MGLEFDICILGFAFFWGIHSDLMDELLNMQGKQIPAVKSGHMKSFLTKHGKERHVESQCSYRCDGQPYLNELEF